MTKFDELHASLDVLRGHLRQHRAGTAVGDLLRAFLAASEAARDTPALTAGAPAPVASNADGKEP
jgi:hypothetical protein